MALALAAGAVVAAGAAEIPRLAGELKLDGRFSAAKWEGAQVIPFTTCERTTAYLARTEDEILIGVVSRHGRIAGRLAEFTAHDSDIWRDDSIDVFIGVPGREGYFHVVANTRGGIYDDFTDANRRVSTAWDSGARAAGSFDVPGDSFYVELKLPIAALAPVEGRVTLAIASYKRWAIHADNVLGTSFKPETWTAFDLGRTYPVEPVGVTVPAFAGRQACAFELLNRSDAPVELKGEFEGTPVKVALGPGERRTVTAFNAAEAGESKETVLRLCDAEGRRMLEVHKNMTARPLLTASLVSDIVYAGEEVQVRTRVHEPQTESVAVSVAPDRVTCVYKDQKVVIPYRTIPNPWKEGK